MTPQTRMYAIPEKFRIIENLHIVFWLVKDLSWAMLWKPLGLLMVIPTIGAALVITWQTRKIRSEFFHNLAVDWWICANAYWMVIEFFELPDEYRYYTAIPFSIGLLHIVIYYAYILPKEKRLRKVEMVEVAS